MPPACTVAPLSTASWTCSSRPSAARRDTIGEYSSEALPPSSRGFIAAAFAVSPGDELVEDVLHHDHPLVGVAGLADVLDPEGPGRVDGLVHVGGVEHDVGVGATELEHDLLEVAAGFSGDGRAGTLGAGERDAVDTRVGDHRRDLLVGGEQVDVRAFGHPGVAHDVGDGLR